MFSWKWKRHSFLILAHLALFPFGRGTHHRWKWSVFSTKRPRLTRSHSDLDDVRILYNITTNEIRFCTLWQDFEKAVWSNFEQEMSFLLTKSLQSTESEIPPVSFVIHLDRPLYLSVMFLQNWTFGLSVKSARWSGRNMTESPNWSASLDFSFPPKVTKVAEIGWIYIFPSTEFAIN